jgi:hypothetical protein
MWERLRRLNVELFEPGGEDCQRFPSLPAARHASPEQRQILSPPPGQRNRMYCLFLLSLRTSFPPRPCSERRGNRGGCFGDDPEAVEGTSMTLSDKANEPTLVPAIDLFGELLERRLKLGV